MPGRGVFERTCNAGVQDVACGEKTIGCEDRDGDLGRISIRVIRISFQIRFHLEFDPVFALVRIRTEYIAFAREPIIPIHVWRSIGPGKGFYGALQIAREARSCKSVRHQAGEDSFGRDMFIRIREGLSHEDVEDARIRSRDPRIEIIRPSFGYVDGDLRKAGVVENKVLALFFARWIDRVFPLGVFVRLDGSAV